MCWYQEVGGQSCENNFYYFGLLFHKNLYAKQISPFCGEIVLWLMFDTGGKEKSSFDLSENVKELVVY